MLHITFLCIGVFNFFHAGNIKRNSLDNIVNSRYRNIETSLERSFPTRDLNRIGRCHISELLWLKILLLVENWEIDLVLVMLQLMSVPFTGTST